MKTSRTRPVECTFLVLLRGTIVKRTHDTHKKTYQVYIYQFFLTIFGPINYDPPKYCMFIPPPFQSTLSLAVAATKGSQLLVARLQLLLLGIHPGRHLVQLLLGTLKLLRHDIKADQALVTADFARVQVVHGLLCAVKSVVQCSAVQCGAARGANQEDGDEFI